MNRRRFLAGAVAAASAPARSAVPFADGQSFVIEGREHVASDIIVPSPAPLSGTPETASDYAGSVFRRIIDRAETIVSPATPTDRWGRIKGAVRLRLDDGRVTTLQEYLLQAGAARVAPESDDHDFIDRCFTAESAAREAKSGLWSKEGFRIREAARGELAWGFQIYQGVIRSAADPSGRVFFNFGEDFRDDLTASVTKGDFRRWRRAILIENYAGLAVEVRGLVAKINGPSIELLHELQMRIL